MSETPIKPITNSTLALSKLNDDSMTVAQRHKEIIKEVTGVGSDEASIFLMELARDSKANNEDELAFKCASEVMKNQTRVSEAYAKAGQQENQSSVNINMNNSSSTQSTGPTFDLEDVTYE